MRRYFCAFFLVFMICILSGCIRKNQEEETDAEYAVCDNTMLPTELVEIIEDKKEKPFTFSFVSGNYMYILVGYGEHAANNLRVVVEDFRTTNKAIYIRTNLKSEGNEGGLEGGEPSMFPYIVIRCEKLALPVVFEES